MPISLAIAGIPTGRVSTELSQTVQVGGLRREFKKETCNAPLLKAQLETYFKRMLSPFAAASVFPKIVFLVKEMISNGLPGRVVRVKLLGLTENAKG